SVRNTANNSVNTALVLITADDPLPDALAGEDQEICNSETTLKAAPLSARITGAWTTLENSLVIDPANPTTSVADLAIGTNTYVWTLSSENCGAFSADTVTINIPSMPVAENDVFEIQSGSGFNTLDLIENDQPNATDFLINILETPTTSQVNEIGNGEFEFVSPARYFGSQQFVYEVCSRACTNLCDVANVRVTVLPGIGVDTTNTVPNAITPNGDGKNDLLLIDELIFDAADFPRSELIIFNRWGDVVFSASPYNNDWGGKSTSGTDLPEGTYYYVLRLDTVEGEVMKGDITILR
ncbi:MAG: gliding motility-associated C-terminal domain-containing protein, partial [Saprospiraceae bacterium]